MLCILNIYVSMASCMTNVVGKPHCGHRTLKNCHA
ncbi:unnamed protein product [Callosobruchus maculatus]|uniref:Uncharacterized protein n=1 Tax=Callosobruchus maculatus TaxID=64391 RepID=A0A653DH70_CALMS|nr:unnamed protein product [Callosobruchus maculatus]VEN58871.1 unnamed protein product [Callosobruchus maculatus]